MSKTFQIFEKEDLFKAALRNGINLFCGAGFSVEAKDMNQNYLPIGKGLLDELKRNFASIRNQPNLSRACTMLIGSEKESFYDFLTRRFTVATYDERYNSIQDLKIRNIYTTNIDDLITKLYKSCKDGRYLTDLSVYGAEYPTNGGNNNINYYPLHGSVSHKDRDYVFGTTELAGAFLKNGRRASWESLSRSVANEPTLFWGWNFEDADVLQAMYPDVVSKDNIYRWALVHDRNDAIIDFLHTLGINVIVGDTSELLDYIDAFTKENATIIDTAIENEDDDYDGLEEYCVPESISLGAYSLKSFYTEYTPRWSLVYSKSIPKTSHYSHISNLIASGKNIIVNGMRGTGKTTLCMQLAVEYPSGIVKHCMNAPSLDQVNSYLELLGKKKSLLFIDDGLRDTNALLALLRARNVQVVCFVRDFSFERQHFAIMNERFKEYCITEISIEDAQTIINSIPNEIKRQRAGTKRFNKDKTIPALLVDALKPIDYRFLTKFFDSDEEAADLFLMICYVHSCDVPCSFDMVYSYVGDTDHSWEEMLDMVERAGALIRDWNGFDSYDIKYSLQNYYQCRSSYFAEKILNSIPREKLWLSRMLMKFVQHVPTYKICSFDKFKRTAFDADLIARAFQSEEDGENYYNACIQTDDSEYIYQQAALYFSKKEDYQKAFKMIECARNLSRYNRFSVQATHALISFKANIGYNQELTENALKQLAECCRNDKRKAIHYIHYCNCSIKYYEEYNDDNSAAIYLEQALEYISDARKERIERKNGLTVNNMYSLIDLEVKIHNLLEKANHQVSVKV